MVSRLGAPASLPASSSTGDRAGRDAGAPRASLSRHAGQRLSPAPAGIAAPHSAQICWAFTKALHLYFRQRFRGNRPGAGSSWTLLAADGRDQVPNLLIHLLRAGHSVGNFCAQESAEPLPQPVNVGFNGAFRNPETLGGLGVGRARFGPRQKLGQLDKALGLAFLRVFLLEPAADLLKDREGPAPIVEFIQV